MRLSHYGIPTRCSLVAAFAVALTATPCLFQASGQTVVSGTQLEIGPAGSDQVSALVSGAIGAGNQVKAPASLAVGGTNVIEMNGVVFGSQNRIDTAGTTNIIVGSTNRISSGTANFISGRYNVIETDGTASHIPLSTFVSGEGNDLNGTSTASIVSGSDNWTLNAPYSASFGRALNNFWTAATIVGQFNATPGSAPLFVVGSGSSNAVRANLLEVLASGSIRLLANTYLSGTLTVPNISVSGGIDVPNQGITTAASVLTRATADARYPLRSDTSFVLFGGTASNPGSVAIGSGAAATGDKSLAWGEQAVASGTQSIALGGKMGNSSAQATAVNSIAIGNGSAALAPGSISIGTGLYNFTTGTNNVLIGNGGWAVGNSNIGIGDYACVGNSEGIAIGHNVLNTGNGITMGVETQGNQPFSVTIGNYSVNNVNGSILIGLNSTQNSYNGVVLGEYCSAGPNGGAVTIGSYSSSWGQNSVAIGNNVQAVSRSSFVVGQYNAPSGDGINWVPSDELFVVGNGASSSQPSNAFVVKKNGDTIITGNTTVSGTLQAGQLTVSGTLAILHVQPGGDIPMLGQ